MEQKRRSTDSNGMFKQVMAGILVILIAGWITYVSVKGTSLDAMIAGIHTRVSVLEMVATTIKEDIAEIKTVMKEIRDSQRTRR